MRLKLALFALPLALLAAFFVFFQRPQLGATPVAGSTTGAPATAASSSGSGAPGAMAPNASAPAPAAVAASGALTMDPSTPTAEATSPILKSITVVGQGQVKVAPDVAYVGVGVRTRENTAQDAQNKNNQAMADVIAKIKALGIEDKDIQTSGISLYPVYADSNVISGYEAANSVTVTVDVPKVGQVIDAAVAAGANSNLSVAFGLKDPTAATQQALEAATTNARARADAIAKGLGVTIKEVQIAVEQGAAMPTPIAVREVAAASSAGIAPTPVQAGQLNVTSTVQVTYTY